MNWHLLVFNKAEWGVVFFMEDFVSWMYMYGPWYFCIIGIISTVTGRFAHIY